MVKNAPCGTGNTGLCRAWLRTLRVPHYGMSIKFAAGDNWGRAGLSGCMIFWTVRFFVLLRGEFTIWDLDSIEGGDFRYYRQSGRDS